MIGEDAYKLWSYSIRESVANIIYLWENYPNGPKNVENARERFLQEYGDEMRKVATLVKTEMFPVGWNLKTGQPHPNAGRIWITNGKTNRRISPKAKIPNGYWQGVTHGLKLA